MRFNKYTFNTSKKLVSFNFDFSLLDMFMKFVLYYLFIFINIFYLLTKVKFKIILEEVFDVKVISLNSLILPLKRCRRGKFTGFKNSYKRFYITIVCFLRFIKTMKI